VLLPDGQPWEFRFVRVACNVAHPVGEDANRLPDLMRAWFGDQAGLPGTDFRVRFTRRAAGWVVAPLATTGVSSPRVAGTEGVPSRMVAEPPAAADAQHWVPVVDLAAAASEFSDAQQPEPKGWLELAGHRGGPGAFVAQVRGHSMEPTIPDGSWCLFRRVTPGSREGRVLLVQHRTISDPENGGRYTVKRYRSRKVPQGETWRHAEITLDPDNPGFKPIAVDPVQADDLRVIAEFVAVAEHRHNDGAI
jgi:SOS-response transcriptional repressor LexA